MKKRPAYKLVLSDGTEWIGEAFGFLGRADGETVFNTAMTGYEESFTDPSYAGQILVTTYPLIGNYGVSAQEKDEFGLPAIFESDKIHLRGLIVSEYCEEPSHWRLAKTLEQWLIEEKIPAITGIDTRALTEHLRTHGPKIGQILPAEEASVDFSGIEDPNERNLAGEVGVQEIQWYTPKNAKKRVILFDTGVKNNILREFLKRDIEIVRVPWDFAISEADFSFDGVFCSNGPGDPQKAEKTAFQLKWAIGHDIPTFGICLGNQLLAIASGAATFKLPYGHRGGNQPCTEQRTKRCYITSQNHGFAIDEKTLSPEWTVWWRNANDESVEGVMHESERFFSVQFHPESCPGPEDTSWLFDFFIDKL